MLRPSLWHVWRFDLATGKLRDRSVLLELAAEDLRSLAMNRALLALLRVLHRLLPRHLDVLFGPRLLALEHHQEVLARLVLCRLVAAGGAQATPLAPLRSESGGGWPFQRFLAPTAGIGQA